MNRITYLAIFLMPFNLSAEALKIKLTEINVTSDGAMVSKWEKIVGAEKDSSTNNILVIGLPEETATGDTWEGYVVREGAYTTKDGLKIPKYSVANSTPNTSESKKTDLSKNVFIVKTDKATGTGFAVKLDGRDYFITNLHVVDGAKSIEVYNYNGEKIEIPKTVEVNLTEDLFRFEVPNREGLLISPNVEMGEKATAFGNSQGSNVLTESNGKVIGIGPDSIEVSCDIVGGNSGGPVVNKNAEVVGIATYLTFEENKWNKGTRFSKVRKFALKIKNNEKWCSMPYEIFLKESEILANMEKSLDQIVDVAFQFAKNATIGSNKLLSSSDQKRIAQAKLDVAIQSYNRNLPLYKKYFIFFQMLADACDALSEENRGFWVSEWSKNRYKTLSERSMQYAAGIRAWREEVGKRIR